jgi:large subunit ribosomal protein L21
MKAIIKTGGKQYLVSEGQILTVESLPADQKKIDFEVLATIDGDKTKLGSPVLSGVKAAAEVVDRAKSAKIKVLKFKAKKRQKTLTGHRQNQTQVKITRIG